MMINIKKIILPNSITLHKGFLDHSFCDYVANNFKDYFEYTPRSEWNAYTLRDKNQLETKNSEIMYLCLCIF